MKTIFFTQDQDLCSLQELEQVVFQQCEDPEEIQGLIGEGPVVLVLDYDLDKKAAEKLSGQYSEQEHVHRIVVGKKFSSKELKNMQSKADAANGYFSKPLSQETFLGLIEDFEMIMGIEEEEVVDIDHTDPTQVSASDGDKTADNVLIPDEINSEIPEQLESVDGEPLTFDEADSDIVFDVGDGADQEDATNPGMTSPTVTETAAVEDDVEIDIDDEVLFDVEEETEIEEESGEEEEVEFAMGEGEEEVQFDAEESIGIAEEVVPESDDDLTAENTGPGLELAEEDQDVEEDGPGLDLDDSTFGEIELSNKVSSRIDEGDGLDVSEEASEERVDEDATGEFETIVTEINEQNDSISCVDSSEETTIPGDNVNAMEEVKILSDEEKAAIARIEKIDYTYDENELVKSQVTIRHMREERKSLLKEVDQLKSEKRQKEQDALSLRAELDETKIEVSILKKRRTEDMENVKYQLRLSDEKKKIFEEKVKHYQSEFAKLDKKVRVDISQVRQREKELENKLELTMMDADSQIKSRDLKIAELKRKIDSLEFNMENVSINEQKLREDKLRLEERISKIMSTLRNSISMIEDDLDLDDELLLEKLNKL